MFSNVNMVFFSNRNGFSHLSTSTLLRHVSNYNYDFKPYENVLLSVKKMKLILTSTHIKINDIIVIEKNKYT